MNKKKVFVCLISFLSSLSCAGCFSLAASEQTDSLTFQEDDLYAVAYLGYQQINDLDYYTEHYLESNRLPVHYLSGGDYYLIIPRYSDMELSLYQNDLETMESDLIYEDPNCRPFLIQCNVSDIFPDVTIRLNYQDETVEFSPFISLRDGSLDIGEHGLDITRSEDSMDE